MLSKDLMASCEFIVEYTKVSKSRSTMFEATLTNISINVTKMSCFTSNSPVLVVIALFQLLFVSPSMISSRIMYIKFYQSVFRLIFQSKLVMRNLWILKSRQIR